MALNFYFLKNTEIFKLKFLEISAMNFSEIFRGGRGVDCLSICKFWWKSLFLKKVTENFSKFFLGGPPSQGVPKFWEGVGVVDRGPRDLSNAVKILALRLSCLELNWILLKYLNLIFSEFPRWIFLKFSGKVRGSIVYRPGSFQENRSF